MGKKLTAEKYELMLADLELVRRHFPKAFPRPGEGRVQPLRQRVNKDLVEKSRELNLGLTWARARNVLSFWCTRTYYLNAFRKAKGRIDLYGTVTEELSADHRAYAKERCDRQWLDSVPANIKGLSPAPLLHSDGVDLPEAAAN